MRIYDVSVSISEDLPTWPGDPGVLITRSSSLDRGDAANVSQIWMGAHTGTHIDAPLHFEPDGASVDELPLEILIGPCRVFHLPDGEKEIGPSVLGMLDVSGVKRVLFKTRNSELWRRGERGFQKEFVSLSPQGALFLAEQGVALVGIDYLSIEQFSSADHATHHILLRQNIVILEGLDLSRVPAGDYELIALPIKLKGAEGAPCRVVLREMDGSVIAPGTGLSGNSPMDHV